ncbi:MAG: SGNH/GDSL hydrolase family protein [Clostridiales bacterium]|nr:SGNH/GDSL hydrolase family protein [Clostridiales bacterium]
MEIESVDSNFKIKSSDDGSVKFYDVSDFPFTVHGLLHDNAGYYRIPYEIAASVNAGVQELNLHTAGGRVRFRSDANRIILRVHMRCVTKMPHFALTGSAGFDLYADGIYQGTFVPPYDLKDGYTSELMLSGGILRDITVHFPLYSGVERLELGFPSGSMIEQANPYVIQLPVVYYGSSITQGGCASRPGNAYQNILSRILLCDYINLGFSGSAKGEKLMAEYIASLDMSAFVMDYDHNAPDPDYLKKTHSDFFKIIREKNPFLPVIILSRPQPNPDKEDFLRLDIIRKTYDSATQGGDKYVYFIDGTQMLRLFGGDSGTVDDCHPNDLGFYCMAKSVEEKLKAVLSE